jgi:hypothetical protein
MSLVLPSLIGASKPAGSYSRFSVSFDGTDDYISLGSSFTLSGAWSASFWVKPEIRSDNTFNMNLFGNLSSGSVYLFIGSDGKVRVNNIEISNALTNGVWQNIVVTRDGSDSLKGYVNGSLQDTDTISGNLTFDQIGRYFNGSAANFKGLMDEVAVWNAELSANDISSIYNSGVPNDLSESSSYDTDRTSNLVHWWRMGDGTEAGSGTTVFDMSTNSNNGTLNGVSFSTDVPS